MKYEVIPTKNFKIEAKKLLKKYKSLDLELRELYDILVDNPKNGTPLGNNAYKIRLSIKSKVAGKSGGSRVITYVLDKYKKIYLLSIYDKAEFASVDTKTIKEIIKQIVQLE